MTTVIESLKWSIISMYDTINKLFNSSHIKTDNKILYKNAILANNISDVRFLIDNNQQVCISSVRYAVYTGNIEIFELLMKYAYINHDYEVMSIALFNEDTEMIGYLFRNNTRINTQSLEGAIRSKNLQMVDLILDFVNINDFKRLFEYTLLYGTLEILQFFITNTTITISEIYTHITTQDIITNSQFSELKLIEKNDDSIYHTNTSNMARLLEKTFCLSPWVGNPELYYNTKYDEYVKYN